MKNAFFRFSAIELVALLVTAFLLTVVADASAAELREVRIATVAYANTSKVGYNGSAGVIDQEGWLKNELQKRGIKLTWVPVAAQSVGATVNEAFANHRIDFAGYGDLPSIILNAGGVETRIIVPGGAGSNVYLVVPAGSPVKSVAELKGKRIALHRGRPWEITFARLAATHGLKLSDFKIANLNPGAGAAALAAGNVDAFVTMSDAYQLEDRKIGKIIWSTKQFAQGGKMRAELWGSKAFIEQYPEITQIVANAHVRATHWISQDANFESYLKIAARSGQPEDVLRREYGNDSVSWKARWSPLFDEVARDHYKNAIAYSRQVNLIRRDLTVDQLFEPKFLEAAIKSQKLEGYWEPRVLPNSTRQAGS